MGIFSSKGMLGEPSLAEQAQMVQAQAHAAQAHALAREQYFRENGRNNKTPLELEAQRVAIQTAQSGIRQSDAQTNRIGMLAPAERDKYMADADHSRSQAESERGLLPNRQELLASQSYGLRAPAYLAERLATPDGAPTPTDPRSIGYGGGGGGLRAGMATGDGTYSPGPRTVSAPSAGASGPQPDANGVYYDNVGRPYRGASAPQPRPAPQRRSPMAGPSSAFGDGDPLVTPPGPTSLASTAAMPSNFSAPFAARGMTNFSGNGMAPRLRAGMGIYQGPSSSFTSMIGSDPAEGLSRTRDPVSGEGYGMVPQQEAGWATRAGYR